MKHWKKLTGLLIFTGSSPLFAQDSIKAVNLAFSSLQKNIDFVWLLMAAGMVFIMQAGFMCLESGMARAKNSINVAVKNFADFVIASIGFWVVGFGLMFGESVFGIFGSSEFLPNMDGDAWKAAFFIFQAVFAGTAATIDSGAVAERTKFSGYIILSFLVSVLIYPVFGHWAWGGLLNPSNAGWLEKLGFIDFAGSTVVHSIGAWIGLAGVIVVGPRIGKFDKKGKARKFQPHSLQMVYLGTFLLFFGWFGFNAGSTLKAGPDIANIIFKTLLSAVSSGFSATALSWIFNHDKVPEAEMLANGVLGGLVAITAGCSVVSTGGSVIIGLVAGVLVFFGSRFMENKLKLDDVVGAVPVHGFAGAWGTLAIAFFIPTSKLTNGMSRMDLLGVQTLGVFSAFVWAFSLAFIFLTILKKLNLLRVSEDHEKIGLNVSEHGAQSSLLELSKSIEAITKQGLDAKNIKVHGEHGTEAGELAIQFNNLVDVLQEKFRREHFKLQEQQKAIQEAHQSERYLREKMEGHRSSAGEEFQRYQIYMEKHVNHVGEKIDAVESVLFESSNMAVKMKETISEFVATTHSLLSSFQQVSVKTNQASRISEQSVNAVQNGIMTVRKLDSATQEIQKIIQNINQISKRTKLLSMNAGIEASKAGLAGRGFSVVADEVKKLADLSSNFTQEIVQHLKSIHLYTTDTVTSMEDISSVMNEINSINQNLAKTAESESSQANESIEGAVNRSSAMVEEVVNRIEMARTNAKKVAEKVGHSSQEFESLLIKSSFFQVQS